MDDTYVVNLSLTNQPDMNLFGVFHGVGGAEVAMFVRDNITSTLIELESFKEEQYEDALKECFMLLDNKLKESEVVRKKLLNYGQQEISKENKYLQDQLPQDITQNEKEQLSILKTIFDPRNLTDANIAMFSGTTACIVLIVRDYIYIANAGNSKCILFNIDNKEIKETKEHWPNNKDEKERIEQAEGKVSEDNKINNTIGISRLIGFLEYKQVDWLKQEDQMVTAMPDVYTYNVKEFDYIVLATNGVWCWRNKNKIVENIITWDNNEEVFSNKIKEIFEKVLIEQKESINKKNVNNMTMIVVKLNEMYKKKKYEKRINNSSKIGKNKERKRKRSSIKKGINECDKKKKNELEVKQDNNKNNELNLLGIQGEEEINTSSVP